MNIVKCGLSCLLLTFLLPIAAQDAALQVSEVAAFEGAVGALADARKTGIEGNLEEEWSKGLKVLALSPSKQADVLLAKLALFSVDGALGEEFSCAAFRRSKGLTMQLRRQLRQFDTSNDCFKIAARENVNREKLCMTKRQFSKIVSQYRDLPLKDTEGACSY